MGSSYRGLESSFLLGGCPVSPNSNGNKYVQQNRCYSHKIGPYLFPEPGTLLHSCCHLVTHCLCWAFVFRGFPVPLTHLRPYPVPNSPSQVSKVTVCGPTHLSVPPILPLPSSECCWAESWLSVDQDVWGKRPVGKSNLSKAQVLGQ